MFGGVSSGWTASCRCVNVSRMLLKIDKLQSGDIYRWAHEHMQDKNESKYQLAVLLLSQQIVGVQLRNGGNFPQATGVKQRKIVVRRGAGRCPAPTWKGFRPSELNEL